MVNSGFTVISICIKTKEKTFWTSFQIQAKSSVKVLFLRLVSNDDWSCKNIFYSHKKIFNTTVKRNVLQISGMGVTNNIRQTDTKGKCYKVAWSEWASPREKFSILKPFSKSRSYEGGL
jgi:hypothetical protein